MIIVGLDLSLCNSGMVAIPSDWDRNWKRVEHETFRTKADDYPFSAERLGQIATRCADFVRRVDATHVYVEDYLRSHRRSSVGYRLAEVGGCVKLRILEWTGLDVVPVNVTDARSLFLGSAPPRNSKLVKKVICAAFTSLGGPFGNNDHEADAAVVANYGLSEQGLWCLAAA